MVARIILLNDHWGIKVARELFNLNKKELIPMNKIKTTDWIKYIALFISLKMSAYADLMISGLVDGDLSGGNPKGIL